MRGRRTLINCGAPAHSASGALALRQHAPLGCVPRGGQAPASPTYLGVGRAAVLGTSRFVAHIRETTVERKCI